MLIEVKIKKHLEYLFFILQIKINMLDIYIKDSKRIAGLLTAEVIKKTGEINRIEVARGNMV